ncbi:MAG: hypothetical protein DMG15_10755, partial [Acidobacteria bacterium]
MAMPLFAHVVCVHAQVDRGTIVGAVTDPSGAVIPGTQIKVVKIDTNATTDLETNSAGLYTAPNLPLGTYRLIFEKAGFGKLVRQPVEIRAGGEVRVDATLSVGNVSESVSVSTEAPLIDVGTVSNTAGFKSELTQELPLINTGTKRDITAFIQNLPGANGNTMNGAVNGSTEVFIDGAPANERLVNGGIAEVGPYIEMVGEISVSANAFNAEFGGFGSFFTNVTIKSGTNQLHGSIFDHLGNSVLNARSFFQPFITPYRQNEGGFTIGGPVVLPKIYNGRNRTFFFGSLGLFYSRSGSSSPLITIPTQAQVKGDFSGFANNGVQIPIYDPDTGVPDGKGSIVRTQFPGNIIPATRIASFAATVASYIPPTNLPGINNNFYDHKAPTWPYFNIPSPLVKIDHQISTTQKLMASFTAQIRHRLLWGNPGSGLGPQPKWGQTQTYPLDWYTYQIADSWKYRTSHDWVVKPNLLNHLTLSFDRYWNFGVNPTAGQGWDTKLGIKGLPPGIPLYNGEFPAFTFSGGTGVPVNFGRGYDENWHELRYSLIDNLTYIRGTHTMKFGIEFDRDRINRQYQGGGSGTFNFSNQMTSQPNSSALATQGSAFASFLLGQIQSASADQGAGWAVRYPRYALFAQDDWHLTKALTLYYGLRWDYDAPYYELQNRLSSFVPTLPNPGAGGRFGALGFAGSGQGGIGKRIFEDPWKRGFGPRLGLAYQMNSKTVVRSSGGIYYSRAAESAAPVTFGYSNTPTFNSPDGYTQIYNLATESFPSVPALPNINPSLRNGQSILYIPPSGGRLPQIATWTFSIQREVRRNLSLEATYIGSRSTHLAFTTNYNPLPIRALQYGNTLLQPITSATAAAAGITSPFPSFASQTGANTVFQSLKPYPQYTAVTAGSAAFAGASALGGVADTSGQSKYNSLQIKANKRFSNGLTFIGFYTWSKSFSRAQGQFPDWRFWQLDANPPAVLSFSWAYQLPFGKGRSLFNTNSKVLNAVVSGWKVNGFVRYADGVPLTIAGAGGLLGQLGYGQWASAVAGVSPYATTNPRDFSPAVNRYLNAAAFTLTTGFNFGNLAPNPSWIRGFTSKSESLTAGRIFRVRERLTFDFSVDATNPFNFHRWN